MLKAGFGMTGVIPERCVRLGGYGVKEIPVEEIFDNLHSTTLVLEQGNIKTVIINLDWLCIEEDVVEQIRSDINKRTGINKEHISVCTIPAILFSGNKNLDFIRPHDAEYPDDFRSIRT